MNLKYENWQEQAQKRSEITQSQALKYLLVPYESMGPNIEAECDFVRASGAPGIIGAQEELPDLLCCQNRTRGMLLT